MGRPMATPESEGLAAAERCLREWFCKYEDQELPEMLELFAEHWDGDMGENAIWLTCLGCHGIWLKRHGYTWTGQRARGAPLRHRPIILAARSSSSAGLLAASFKYWRNAATRWWSLRNTM